MPSNAPDDPQHRLHLVARAFTDAIYDWDIATGELWLSDSFFQGFGYQREHFPATITAWEAQVHPNDWPRIQAELKAVRDSRAESWSSHYRFARRDGSHASVLDRGFLIRDEAGVATRMVGGMIDLTQQQRTQTDLRLLRRAIEITDNSIVIADAQQPDLPIVYVNPAFSRITGYPAEEAIGRNARFLQRDDRDQAGVIALHTAVLEGREARVSLRNYRKDGELFWNDFTLTPLRDDNGQVTHYVGMTTDATVRHRYEEQLAHRATHDQFTGLPNRQLALDRLGQALANADRHGQSVVVLFIDLDDFKLVNDSLGHGAGDQVLHAVAERLSTLVDHDMTIARFGGDEFVLVATQDPAQPAHAELIARVFSVVSRPIDVDAIQHTITPSIGYAISPRDGDSAELLLMRADMAMYHAKRQGRNRAVRYQPEFNASVSQRLQLVSRLREALENKEFRLEFQPMYARDGSPVALEALVRWQHPQRGLLLPSEFIGVCEESGLIVELGRRVLLEAARHHALFSQHGFGHLRMAVNVSAAQFGDNLYDDVAEAIALHALPPHVLELELTESTVMASPQRSIRTMHRLSDLGISIAIDDFGTGYSSLAYLNRLPISRLKIDRSFVRNLEMDANDQAICSSIIAMAKSLGLNTTAEGVETAEQLQWLRAQGIDEVQGYLMARPADFEQTLAHIAQAWPMRTPA